MLDYPLIIGHRYTSPMMGFHYGGTAGVVLGANLYSHAGGLKLFFDVLLPY